MYISLSLSLFFFVFHANMTDPQSNFEESNNVDTSLLSPTIKCKNYRVKNNEWHCRICSIYCNSTLQFEMHLVSQKHKIIDLEQKTRRETSQITEASHESTNSKAEFNSNKECVASNKEECVTPSPDENNNSSIQAQSVVAIMNQSQRSSNVIRIKSSYSPSMNFFYFEYDCFSYLFNFSFLSLSKLK